MKKRTSFTLFAIMMAVIFALNYSARPTSAVPKKIALRDTVDIDYNRCTYIQWWDGVRCGNSNAFSTCAPRCQAHCGN